MHAGGSATLPTTGAPATSLSPSAQTWCFLAGKDWATVWCWNNVYRWFHDESKLIPWWFRCSTDFVVVFFISCAPRSATLSFQESDSLSWLKDAVDRSKRCRRTPGGSAHRISMYSVQYVQSLPVLRPAPSLPPQNPCDFDAATPLWKTRLHHHCPPDCINQNYITGHFMVHMAYMAWQLYLDLSFKFGCLVVVTSLISTGWNHHGHSDP